MTDRRGRGRRDNGLDAVLWSPVRDVDPRVGEHLLDVLEAAGIAAYLEPAADVGPYTRSVVLPSPPSDRLFVDRARRVEARGLVEQHADDHPVEPRVARRPAGRDLDEDAEWRRIVAAFEAEHGRPAVQEGPADPPPPTPHEVPVLDRPEEHYEPPAPPPLPVPAPAVLYALLLVAAGILLIGVPSVIGLSADAGLVLGVAVVAGGVALLVSRMRDRSDDGDDGAVV
ncbi:hypothetical protein QOZ88_18090 [Blastococcus sp. BMG 814]|uniref:DUF308 domain-containing protein n=1 Tax=Blastococcus carthaginiensis TaxID=3050034 RepID=A0ABT9IG40_9ACTN|nr:hypothetical protein [Blastococcus carthaginiensis]MDP5184551.1 hypothetical protein [Blastococcus carthaginiensis]